MTQAHRKAIVALFMALWFASLFLPTLRTNGADWDPGWWLLASAQRQSTAFGRLYAVSSSDRDKNNSSLGSPWPRG